MAKAVRIVLGSLALLATVQGAVAQTEGLYIALGAGLNLRQDSDLTLKGTGAAAANGIGLSTDGTLGFNGVGPVVHGTLGWGFGSLRAELEFSYRNNDVKSLSLSGIPGDPSLSGSADTYAVMANLLYDVRPLRFTLGVPVTPYVGLGAGYAWSSYREIMMRTAIAGAATYGVDGRFAYQAIAGLSWDLSGLAPGLSLTTEYRYFAVLDQTVSFGAQIGRFGFRDVEVEATNRNHGFLIGLRYAFRSPSL
jgi:opacity protein-like surface antigen